MQSTKKIFFEKTIKTFIALFLICATTAQAQNLTICGVGKLGLTMGLCLEKAGYNVLGVDVSEEYVRHLNNKVYSTNEPGVEQLLKESRNFRATTSLKEGLEFSDICFILVATNTFGESYNFGILEALLEKINQYQVKNKNFVICCTVIPTFIKEKAKKLLSDCQGCTISYNPPFIAQGEIVKGYLYPDMVLIGGANEEIANKLEKIHKKMVLNSPYMAKMNTESAEITKISLNCFLTAKITFANLISEIADQTPGADKDAILKAIGKDSRIGSKLLRPGYGYGGPCLPRDNKLMTSYVEKIGAGIKLFQEVDLGNYQHAEFLAKRFYEENKEEYLFEDVGYKENCPVKIIEFSHKLLVAELLAKKGKLVKIIEDENTLKEVQKIYGDIFQYEVKQQ